MIELGNIVTLENGMEFLLIEQVENEGSKYMYAVRTEADDKLTEEFDIFKVIIDEEGEFLESVDDKTLYDKLVEKFKVVLADRVLTEDFSDIIED